MSTLRTWSTSLRGGAGQVVGTTGVVLVTQAIGGIILARTLGPTNRGLLAALMLWAATATDLADLGVRHATAYWAAARDPRMALGLVRRPLPVLSATALAIYAGLVALSGRYDTIPMAAVVAAGCWALVQPAQLVLQRFQQGLQRMTAFNAMRLTAEAGPTIAYVAFALAGLLTVTTAAVAILTAVALAFAAGVALARRYLRSTDSGTPSSVERRSFWSYSLRSWLNVLAVRANHTVDLLILTLATVSAADIGTYSVAVTSTAVIATLVGSVGFELFPRVASGGSADMFPLIRRYVTGAFGVATLLSALYWFTADWLVPFVYGDEFTAAVEPARILLVGAVAATIARVAGDALAALGHPGRQAFAQTTGAVTTVLMIAVLGVDTLTSVAAAASAGFTATAVLMVVLVLRTSPTVRPRTGRP